jgi:FtsZ-interacting cell division protein YlmF
MKEQFKEVKDFFSGFKDRGEEKEIMREEPKSPTTVATHEGEVRAKRNHSFMKKEENMTKEQVPLSTDVVNKNPRLRIYKPKSYNAVKNIVTDLQNGKIVFLDMNGVTDDKLALKILHFVYGACAALGIEPESEIKNVLSLDPKNRQR